MRYLSVCSGIEAATVAWHPLGWEAAAFSEIEAFPRAVLEHRWGAVPVDADHHHTVGSNLLPLFGDFTQIEAHHVGPIDLLVGGTPCQSFSIAGLRGGLADDRGNLALEFLRLAQRTRAKWLVWENVPGVLSSNGGRDFGAILGGMVELGYGFAYRVLDAQYAGVPQRRRRVFVVGHLGDWRSAAAVLFERHSLQGHSAPSRQARQAVAALTANGVGTCGADDNQGQAGHLIASTGSTAHCLNAGGMGRQDYETETLIATAPLSFGWQNSPSQGDGVGEIVATLDKSKTPAIAFQSSQSGVREVEAHATLDSNNGSRRHNGVITGSAVRRLTPRECERLQGFPDDYTLIPHRGKPAADGPRYKALGNSMAVPVMRWIGERIDAVSALQSEGMAHAA